MGFEIRSLIFDNVLVYETTQLKENWQEPYFKMEDLTLDKGIYKNGPVIFSVAPGENEEKFGHFTYYLPINDQVELGEEKEFRFQKEFEIGEALCLRQADQKLDFYSAAKNMELEDTFYCV
jgi:hypothetical protein